MSISVVIVNWNAGDALTACLDAVCGESGGAEVIVVDNASTDGSPARLRSDSRVRFIQNQGNVGFAPACNQGLQLARGDVLLWLNPDVVVRPQALRRMMALLDEHPDVGLVGPRIILPDGSTDFDGGRNFPSLRGTFAELTYLRRLLPRSHLFGHWRMGWWDHDSSREVPCLVGACMMMRRAVWERVGPLDETIPMYFEDIDYCRRVQDAGWRAYYLAEAQVEHQAGHSSAQSADRAHLEELKWQAQWLYFQRYRSRPAALFFRALVGTLGAARTAALAMAWPIIALFLPYWNRRLSLALRKAARLTLWGVGLRRVESALP